MFFDKKVESKISKGFCLQLSVTKTSKLFGPAEIGFLCLFKLRLIEYKKTDSK